MSYNVGINEAEGYLSDGVYSDWWNWKTDEEIEAMERKSQEHSFMVEQLTLQWLQSVDKPTFTASDLLNSMFKDTIRKGCLLATRRFCRVESIHLKYADAIFRECKPADIIVSKLKEYNLFVRVEEVRRLDLLIEDLKEYRKDLTAYLKVYELQLFMHREMQLKNGDNSHLTMEKSVMREILSILRLFFLTDEMKKMDFDGFVKYTSQYKKIIVHAKSFIPKYTLESSAKYNENWSSRHQHTLLYYLPVSMRDFIKDLVRLRFEKSKKAIHEKVKCKITDFHIQI